jgi:hypothetical protein
MRGIDSSRRIMTPAQKRKLKEHSRAIADILYAEGALGEKPTLERIEKTIQVQLQEYISPEIASFFLENQQEQQQEEAGNLPAH